jgi:SAM-dependent methyltransferase
MTLITTGGGARHGNLQKHLNSNPIQKLLIRRFHATVLGLIQRTGKMNMLDVGCGEGFFLDFTRQAGLEVDYTGADLSLEALAWSRENMVPDLRANVADIHHLPFRHDAFPLVLCLEVLEHIPDSLKGLEELARVSSEFLILSVPHEPLFRASNFLRGKHLSDWGNDPEHIHNYSGQSFRKLVSNLVDVVWHGYSFPWQLALVRKR